MPDLRPPDRPDDPPTVVDVSKSPLVGVVVVTHGQLATELVNAAEMIVGELSGFVAVSIGWHDDVETAREAIAAAISRVARPAGVIVLTDMFGGTPSNLAISVMKTVDAEVIAGMNLPMLVKLARVRGDLELKQAVTMAAEAGRKYINVASESLGG
jgi:mannose PTS system EIIA component